MVPLHRAESVEVDAVGLTRSFDATEINRILNDPRIFPFVALRGSDRLDATPVVADPRHVLLLAHAGGKLLGGFLFAQDEPGIYEVHTNFLPEYRGRIVVKAARLAASWMFTHTDAMILQTRVPVFNRAALIAIKWCDFEHWFDRPKAWASVDGIDHDVKYYRLSYETWAQNATNLIAAGRVFHDKLDSEFIRHGRPVHSHADDQSHDRYVGACFETIFAGQPEKAVILYNRWARFSGYAPVTLVSRTPVILDIGEALLMATENDFKVIKCR